MSSVPKLKSLSNYEKAKIYTYKLASVSLYLQLGKIM